MRRKVKFWLLLLVGMCAFLWFFFLTFIIQAWINVVSLYGILVSFPFFGSFIMYCWFLYRFVYKGVKPKYPIIPPEGKIDIYFPRTNIPRPIFEDEHRFRKSFKRRRKSERQEKRRRKK